MRKTAYLYLLKEVLPIFFIGILTFTFMLLMDKILKLIELIVTRGVSLSQILMLLFFISPSFLVFTIPMGVLLGILLALGRLSADSEIVALKASGFSLYQLFIPVGAFALAAYLLTSFLVFYGLPWGNRGFKATLFLMAQSKADVEVKERVFNDMFEGLVVYVDKVPMQGKKMEGILICDERDNDRLVTIFANEGYLSNNQASQEVILRLINGDLHRYELKTKAYQKVHFDTYDLKLELSKAFTAISKRLKDKEMSIDDVKEKKERLEQAGQDTTAMDVEIQRRYSFPFACIVFGLIGFPLGVQPHRSGRSYGFVLSILVFLGYYTSVMATQILAGRHVISPFMAGWLPNFLFGALGIYLLIKSAREKPFKPAVWVGEAIDMIQRRWKGLMDAV